MLDLWGCATAITLILTRSSIAQQLKDALFYPRLAQWTTRRGRWWADNLETLSRCPMCSGWWITLAFALWLEVPLRQASVAYVCLVLTIAVYDVLVHLADFTLDES